MYYNQEKIPLLPEISRANGTHPYKGEAKKTFQIILIVVEWRVIDETIIREFGWN